MLLTIIVLLALSIPREKKPPQLEPEPSTSPFPKCDEGSCPSEVLNLGGWKLTLPVKDPSNAKRPLEITQPKLSIYELAPWFTETQDKKGVRFRAPVNASVTKNTSYPRSELREMSSSGKEEAGWRADSGIHTMILDQAITAVPKTKPHVVAGQIHDDEDDILVIRLEYPNLFVNVDGENIYTLDDSYTLGKRFTVKLEVSDGKTKVYYNNSPEPVYTLNKKYEKAYFKAGVYTQSNCETENSGDLCTDENYGEVIIYDAEVSHKQ